MKFEFDSFEEVSKEMEQLSKYHDCEKCRGKIVGIRIDLVGNTHCSYCGEKVNYPKLSKKGYEIEKQKWLTKSSLKEGNK